MVCFSGEERGDKRLRLAAVVAAAAGGLKAQSESDHGMRPHGSPHIAARSLTKPATSATLSCNWFAEKAEPSGSTDGERVDSRA